MSRLTEALTELHFLEECASGDSFFHRLHPAVRLAGTLMYIVSVASIGRFDVQSLIILALYPAVLLISAELPAGRLLRRSLWILPFLLFFALPGLLFIPATALPAAVIPALPAGIAAAVALLLRGYLCVLAMLIYAAGSGIGGLAAGLAAFRVPPALVTLVVMTYRYIFLLVEDTLRLIRAYTLRSGGRNGVRAAEWGSLAGQLFLRTYDRAVRLHNSMLIRGFDGTFLRTSGQRPRIRDMIFLLVLAPFCLIMGLAR